MQLNIDAIQTSTYVPDCMTILKLHQAQSQNEHLQHLKEQIIQGRTENRGMIPQDMRTYGPF